MANTNIFNMADTWNNAGTSFHAIKMDVTDSASQTSSKLLELLIGGASKFSVSKNGSVTLAGGADLANSIGPTATPGIVTKGGVRFLHNFSYGINGGSITPEGRNLFLGESAGNLTMGLTATETYHASDNIGIGSYCLETTTTGFRNVAIGHNALEQASSGRENVAIGYSTLSSTHTSWGNVAIGNNALRYLGDNPGAADVLTANYNVAIGNGALVTCSTGWENMAVGNNALSFTTTGSVNSAMGSEVMFQNTTGSQNSAFGVAALQGNTTGSHNCALGDASGGEQGHANRNTTGSYNTFLGAESKPGSPTQRTYMTVVGAQAIGDIDNTIFLGRADTDNVQVGKRLGIGGFTSSFPALKNVGAILAARLADDSADAAFTCGALTASGATSLAALTASGATSLAALTTSGLSTLGGFNTTNYTVKIGSIQIQPYALNNIRIADNYFYSGGPQRSASGYAAGIIITNGQLFLATMDTGGAGAVTELCAVKASYHNGGTAGIGGSIPQTAGVYTGAAIIATASSIQFAFNTTYTAAIAGPVLKQGANGRVGTFVANGATPVAVGNTVVAIEDAIIISLKAVGGTVGQQPVIATITAGVGFTVVATAGDTSTYNYAIIKNAA